MILYRATERGEYNGGNLESKNKNADIVWFKDKIIVIDLKKCDVTHNGDKFQIKLKKDGTIIQGDNKTNFPSHLEIKDIGLSYDEILKSHVHRKEKMLSVQMEHL